MKGIGKTRGSMDDEQYLDRGEADAIETATHDAAPSQMTMPPAVPGTQPRSSEDALTPSQVLARYFGYSTFRPGQDQIIEQLLSGRDVLGIMPTGAGKSICY